MALHESIMTLEMVLWSITAVQSSKTGAVLLVQQCLVHREASEAACDIIGAPSAMHFLGSQIKRQFNVVLLYLLKSLTLCI